jgi:hypothetical protein
MSTKQTQQKRANKETTKPQPSGQFRHGEQIAVNEGSQQHAGSENEHGMHRNAHLNPGFCRANRKLPTP